MKKQNNRLIILLIIMAVKITAVFSQNGLPLTNFDLSIPLDPAVSTGRLFNGLTYYVRKNRKPENRAQLWLVVNAGSVLEDEDQQGLAHFTEHMAFNGTEHFAKHEIIDFLESIGMEYGPEINAYTNFDETVYMLELPSDSVSVMEQAFRILADWAHRVSFEDVEIDLERGVIIEEWRQGRGAGARMFDKQMPVLFKNSKYAERLTIGKKEVIDTCRYETLRRFYRDWYRPDLMAVIAVGDFDKAWILERIESVFSQIPIPDNPRPRAVHSVPGHDETLFAITTDPEATGTGLGIYYKIDVAPEETVRDYRKMLIKTLINAMLNNRLDELTRQPAPPYLYGYTGSGRFVRTKDVAYLSAGVTENGILHGLETLLTEASRARKYGFTPTELERIKTQILRIYEQSHRERDKTESYVFAGEYLTRYLENGFAMGIEREYSLVQELLPGISLEEVNTQVSAWLTEENRVILVNAPEKDDVTVPAEETLLQVFSDIATREITPWVDRVSDAPLLEDMPEPAEITETVEWTDLDVTQWTLSNNIRVVLKPTDFKNDEILFTAFSPGGHSLAPDSAYVSAVTATSIITQSGAGAFDLTELQKKLTGKIVNVAPFISTLTEGLSGECSPEDMETMFQLLTLYVSSPRADSTAFQAFMTRMRGFIENRDARPENAFNDTVRVTMARYHHRARPWSEALLDEINLETLDRFYRERFKDAGDFTFIFVGNFTLDGIEPFVATYLGGLPSTGRRETWRDPGILPPEGVIKKTVYRGMEPKSRVRIIFTGPFNWSRENLYVLNALTEIMRIRLREVIREDMSGTYGVNISGSASLYPNQDYAIGISFGCDPERVEELIESVFLQIQLIKELGPDAADLAKVKEIHLNNFEVNLKRNSWWSNALYAYYFRGQDPALLMRYPELVKGLTAGAVKEAADTWFDFDNYVQVVLMPEGEKSEQDE